MFMQLTGCLYTNFACWMQVMFDNCTCSNSRHILVYSSSSSMSILACSALRVSQYLGCGASCRPKGGLGGRYVNTIVPTPASSTNSLQALVPGGNGAAAGKQPFLPLIPGGGAAAGAAVGLPRGPSPVPGFFMPSPAPSTAASENAVGPRSEVGTDGPPSSGPPSGFGVAAALAAAGNGGPPPFFIPQVASSQQMDQQEPEPVEATASSTTADADQQQEGGAGGGTQAEEATSNGGPYANGNTGHGLLNGPSDLRRDSSSTTGVGSRSLSAAQGGLSFSQWDKRGTSFVNQLDLSTSMGEEGSGETGMKQGYEGHEQQHHQHQQHHHQHQHQQGGEEDPEGGDAPGAGAFDAEGGDGGWAGDSLGDEFGGGQGQSSDRTQEQQQQQGDHQQGLGQDSDYLRQWQEYYVQFGGYEQYQQWHYQTYGAHDINAPAPAAAVAADNGHAEVQETVQPQAVTTATAAGAEGSHNAWDHNNQHQHSLQQQQQQQEFGLDLAHQQHQQAQLVQEVSGTDVGALHHPALPAINTTGTVNQVESWNASHQQQYQQQPGSSGHTAALGAAAAGRMSPIESSGAMGYSQQHATAAVGAAGPVSPGSLVGYTQSYPPSRGCERSSTGGGRPRSSSPGAMATSPVPRSPTGSESALMRISSLPVRGQQGWTESGQVMITSQVNVSGRQMQAGGGVPGASFSGGGTGPPQQQVTETPHALFIPPPVRSQSINKQLLPGSPHSTAKTFFIPEGGPGGQQKTGRGTIGSPARGSFSGEPLHHQHHQQNQHPNQQQQQFFMPGSHVGEGSPRHQQQQQVQPGSSRSPRPVSPLARTTSAQAPPQGYHMPGGATAAGPAGNFFIPGTSAAPAGTDTPQQYHRPSDGSGSLSSAGPGAGFFQPQVNGFLSPTRSGSLRRGSLGPIPGAFGSFDQAVPGPNDAMYMERDSDEGQGVALSSPIGPSMSWQDPRTATHPYDKFIKERLKKVDWKKSPFKQPGKLSKLMPWEQWEVEQRLKEVAGNGG